jgi:uncharacterized protein (DUF1800 family)
MLTYLNNAESYPPEFNENYGRELLELHTVGMVYSEADVLNASRLLTGRTIDINTAAYTYLPATHCTGAFMVLGFSHANSSPAAGPAGGDALVRYLAAHPATAHRVAEKLVRRFVSDTPPPRLVASAAQVYLAQGTAIVPVVKHVVLSADFARAADRKTQRPFEWAAQAVRVLGLQQDASMHTDGSGVVGLLDRLGQVPFGWRPPDGYPDTTQAWATSASLLSRWNAAQALVAGGVKGIGPLDVDSLVGTPAPATVGALVDRLAVRLLGRSARSGLRSALVRSTGRPAGATLDAAAVRALTPGLAALVLSSPEAQVR